jgi:uncharacterized membrane protein YhaH (DUF805 family)
MNHYIAMWTGILDFNGKTSRAGYWVPCLINILVGALVLMLLPGFIKVYDLLLAVATFTLTCRRLRDAGFSWLLVLLNFAGPVPLVGWILAWVPEILCLFPSKK